MKRAVEEIYNEIYEDASLGLYGPLRMPETPEKSKAKRTNIYVEKSSIDNTPFKKVVGAHNTHLKQLELEDGEIPTENYVTATIVFHGFDRYDQVCRVDLPIHTGKKIVSILDVAGKKQEDREALVDRLKERSDRGSQQCFSPIRSKADPRVLFDNDAPGYAMLFHHSEQALIEHLVKPETAQSLVKELRKTSLKYIASIELDLCSTRYICKNCKHGLMDLKTNSNEGGFLDNLYKALKDSTIESYIVSEFSKVAFDILVAAIEPNGRTKQVVPESLQRNTPSKSQGIKSTIIDRNDMPTSDVEFPYHTVFTSRQTTTAR